ncbi:MAG: hypothetical protein CL752_01860 [Chloroflexi bacterium]|nr:hypothetical protein [Chloroflexota bacterium]MCH2523797.1 3'(2'),5'-bisphosphate nucleotidase CysQ [Dehalococcoidia bacterium]
MPDKYMKDLRDNVEDAVIAANDVIRQILTQSSLKVGHKPGEGPVTEADHAADEILFNKLNSLIDGSQWLSEESKQDTPLITGRPTWVVDPLDGTREFIRGLPEFGVSVGLFIEGNLSLGVIGLPKYSEEKGSIFSGLLGEVDAEFKHDGNLISELNDHGEIRNVVVSRHDYEWRRLQYHIPFPTYPCGSAAVKLIHAASGIADVYFSTGPRSVWDVAGGVAVLKAAGGVLLQIDGNELTLSPDQIGIPPYVAGLESSCRKLLKELSL